MLSSFIFRSDISVVISTYNRKKILEGCLCALDQQSFESHRYEAIIVDDGSTDGTEEAMPRIREKVKYPLHYIKQDNRGPAAARNLGINSARGELILFLGDDIIAESNLLDQHIDAHRRYRGENLAILGYATWLKDLNITPFMHWLENGGSQWRFNEMQHDSRVSWRYFYTCIF